MYRKAGVAIATSTAVVLVSGGITAMIPIPAVSGFAGLMVLEVVINGYTFLTVFPCLLLFHHLHFSNKRRNAQRRRELGRRERGPRVARHPHFAAFVRELWQFGGRGRRPHKTKRGAPNPIAARPDNAEDFRPNRRKQADEFIVHVPAPLSFLTKASRDIVVDEWQRLSEERVEGRTLARRHPRIRIRLLLSGETPRGGGAAGPGPCMRPPPPSPPPPSFERWRVRGHGANGAQLFFVHASLSSNHPCFERQTWFVTAKYHLPTALPTVHNRFRKLPKTVPSLRGRIWNLQMVQLPWATDGEPQLVVVLLLLLP